MKENDVAHIGYRNTTLHCEEIPVAELAEEFGTPLYVYSRRKLEDNCAAFRRALEGSGALFCYALKANANPHLLRIIAESGAGADVVSAGELKAALDAGFSPDKICFAGVGKRDDEIEFALRSNIRSINAESVQELYAISRIALRLQVTAPVSLRINPDIDAESHPYISTGLSENKFGIEGNKAKEAFAQTASLPSLAVQGIHTHIGSQITSVSPFVQTAEFVRSLVLDLRSHGINLTHVDFGGGYGVRYKNAVMHDMLPREDDDNSIPSIGDFMQAVLPILKDTGCALMFEPGRTVIADTGMLVTRVLYVKENGVKKFAITDAGMTELIRPALYGAYHQIVPAEVDSFLSEEVDVVGPVCETGDFLARGRKMHHVKQGQYLSVLTAGAYGFALSSNYNARPRPAEVLVNGDRVKVIRERERL